MVGNKYVLRFRDLEVKTSNLGVSKGKTRAGKELS